jgi:hypothetical protein
MAILFCAFKLDALTRCHNQSAGIGGLGMSIKLAVPSVA